jgi:hypothetical protein
MSIEDDVWRLERRVRSLEAWRATVQGKREPSGALSPVDEAVAACRAAGVSEEAIGEARAEARDDDLALVEILTELAEADTMRGRMRRGGLPLEAEERTS